MLLAPKGILLAQFLTTRRFSLHKLFSLQYGFASLGP